MTYPHSIIAKVPNQTAGNNTGVRPGSPPAAGTVWPLPTPIATSDLVGPPAANRQEVDLWSRTEILKSAVNDLIYNSDYVATLFNANDWFLPPTGTGTAPSTAAATRAYAASVSSSTFIAAADGTYSVAYDTGTSKLKLVGDVTTASDPILSYYGTNAAGTKGWYPSQSGAGTNEIIRTSSTTIIVPSATTRMYFEVVGGGGGGAYSGWHGTAGGSSSVVGSISDTLFDVGGGGGGEGGDGDPHGGAGGTSTTGPFKVVGGVGGYGGGGGAAGGGGGDYATAGGGPYGGGGILATGWGPIEASGRGSGGYGNGGQFGGGGGGGVARGWVTVVPGETLTITVGARGASQFGGAGAGTAGLVIVTW